MAVATGGCGVTVEAIITARGVTRRFGGTGLGLAICQRLIQLMGSDKKARNGKLRFVLTPRIGKAATYDASERETLELIMRVTPKVAETDALVRRD